MDPYVKWKEGVITWLLCCRNSDISKYIDKNIAHKIAKLVKIDLIGELIFDALPGNVYTFQPDHYTSNYKKITYWGYRDKKDDDDTLLTCCHICLRPAQKMNKDHTGCPKHLKLVKIPCCQKFYYFGTCTLISQSCFDNHRDKFELPHDIY